MFIYSWVILFSGTTIRLITYYCLARVLMIEEIPPAPKKSKFGVL